MSQSPLFRRKTLQQIDADVATGMSDAHATGMKRVLGVRDLTFMGVAAIVGAGIFSTIGKASFEGGPAIVLLFLFVSVACGFAAMCYAEFASMVPVSGSAYTYAYVAFGELIAWIIGWDLLMEYAIGNIAVAISWSDYFTSLLQGFGMQIPEWLTMDYWTAQKMGSPEATAAWLNAPEIGGVKIICDIPAFFITFIITWIIYVGIKESKRSTNAMVIFKLAVIALVIVAGIFYVRPENWTPFMPNGVRGIMGGTAAVFFSYIGFDAISTTAEECKNPQRDLPKAMFNALIICTVLYVAIALVLTGMVAYTDLNVGDPLVHVFQVNGIDWLAGVIAVSAIVATASVLMVFQLGQPRIWMSMSRDGLLPPAFSRIHPKYKTPSFSTILTGLVVGIPAMFLNLDVVVELCSVGTLFAFVLVCAGIIRLQQQRKKLAAEGRASEIPESRYKIPYVNSRWIVPALFIIIFLAAMKYNHESMNDLFKNRSIIRTEVMQQKLTPQLNNIFSTYLETNKLEYSTDSTTKFVDLSSISSNTYVTMIRTVPLQPNDKYEFGWQSFRQHFLAWVFLLTAIIVAVNSFRKEYSLIPVLGLMSCTYLLCESGTSNWERFLVWLVIGLVVYFLYGRHKSKMNIKSRE